jgi:hypothetical protein
VVDYCAEYSGSTQAGNVFNGWVNITLPGRPPLRGVNQVATVRYDALTAVLSSNHMTETANAPEKSIHYYQTA